MRSVSRSAADRFFALRSARDTLRKLLRSRLPIGSSQVVVGLALGLFSLLCLGEAAIAQAAPEQILFGRGTSLFLSDAEGKTTPQEIVLLGRPATDITALQTDSFHSVVLIGFGTTWVWAPLAENAGAATPIAVACNGVARLSPRGDCAICDEPDGTFSLVPFAANGTKTVRNVQSGDTQFLDPHGVELAFRDGNGIWALPIRRKAKRRLLSPFAPSGGLLISPSGARAVAQYPSTTDSSNEPALFTFALDGKGAIRRLNRGGSVVEWSSDSRWLLIADGSRACLVRATGGQYKCWKNYAAVGLAPDGSYALLRKEAATVKSDGPFDLFVGKSDGAYTVAPRAILHSVAPVALWLPPSPKPLAPPSLPPPPAATRYDVEDDTSGSGTTNEATNEDAENGD